MLLAIICLSFSVGETYAQKHEFANYKRYATENAVLTCTTCKEGKKSGLYGQFHYGRMGEDTS